MSEYGFWNLAQHDPAHVALVDPEGRRLTAGELLAEANRLVHGLRAVGLQQGDRVAAVLPNGAPMVALYLAAAQAGWYLVPINHHLTATEIAYIVQDAEAKAFFGAERFADACRGAAEEFEFPAPARIALGRVPGFRSYAELIAKQPDTLPSDRVAGQVMNYTSGTTGRPKGVRRALAPYDPDAVFARPPGAQPSERNPNLHGSKQPFRPPEQFQRRLRANVAARASAIVHDDGLP